MERLVGFTVAIAIAALILFLLSKIRGKEIEWSYLNIVTVLCVLGGSFLVIYELFEIITYEPCKIGVGCTAEQQSFGRKLRLEELKTGLLWALAWFAVPLFFHLIKKWTPDRED